MWIGKAAQVAITAAQMIAQKHAEDNTRILADNLRFREENVRQQSMIEWMKLRLNAVEKERAQLIAAAIGVKFSIPEFVPAGDKVDETLQEMPNLATVGGDAVEDEADHGRPRTENDPGVSYDQLPGYRKQR